MMHLSDPFTNERRLPRKESVAIRRTSERRSVDHRVDRAINATDACRFVPLPCRIGGVDRDVFVQGV